MDLVGGILNQRANAMGNIVHTIAHLLDHGWISLRQLGYLLDISEIAIYKRKASAVPDSLPHIMRVGATDQIAHNDLIPWLRRYPRKRTKTAHVDAVLSLYETMKRQRVHQEAEASDSLTVEIMHEERMRTLLDDPDLTEEEREWLKHTYS